MKKILITLDDEEEKILGKRAKKNLQTLEEQVQEIIRRSAVKTRNSKPRDRVDDKLGGIFSRRKRG